jgi:hypothetical protein
MFEAFLSCRVFGLPEGNFSTCLEIARKWSGQQNLAAQPQEKIRWEDITQVHTAKAAGDWYEPPPPASIQVQHALISLGSHEGVNFFGFISPLAGMPAAFKIAAAEYLRDQGGSPVELIGELTLDLTKFVVENWSRVSTIARRLEGEIDNKPYSLTGWGQDRPPIKVLHSIEINVKNKRTNIDTSFNIKVDDVATDLDEVAASLRETFGLVSPYLDFERPLH